jgi:hypothetical protein
VRGQYISPQGNTLSLVACASDSELLQCNLIASPCLDPRFHHDVTVVKNCTSAADGLNLGLERAKRKFIACVHQDVCLPDAWDRCLMQQLQEAERRFGPIGAAGVSGAGEVIEPEDSRHPLRAERIGWVVDRGRLLRDGPELPAKVATLDDLLLVARRDSELRVDPDLGFHLSVDCAHHRQGRQERQGREKKGRDACGFRRDVGRPEWQAELNGQ